MEPAVASEVSPFYLDFRPAEQRVTAAGSGVPNAQEDVSIAIGRYQAGMGQFQDVLTAQQALYTALSDPVNARASLETDVLAVSRTQADSRWSNTRRRLAICGALPGWANHS